MLTATILTVHVDPQLKVASFPAKCVSEKTVLVVMRDTKVFDVSHCCYLLIYTDRYLMVYQSR